jgi:glycosyltransferase involved in cell wall biosynthesis
MSTVDVIVPCYLYGHFLKECVESVLTQSGPRVRVLIIDDASPDQTADVATELANNDPRVTFLRHTANRGHIATYNEGIDWASAEYLLLLSADDYLLPGALNRATTLMEQYSDVGFVFGNAVELDEHGGRWFTDAVPCHNGERILTCQEFFGLSGAQNIVPTPTAVIRTEIQKRVGGYRAELPHAGDMEMWLRMAAHASLGFVKTPQAVYRLHNKNMSLFYRERNWLADLEQRRAAFDCFFRACEHLLAGSAGLRKKMLYLLARDAVSQASKAFNGGELELCGNLTEFALRTSSKVARSLPWAKLACKRGMGLGVWRRLQPAAELMRRASIL